MVLQRSSRVDSRQHQCGLLDDVVTPVIEATRQDLFSAWLRELDEKLADANPIPLIPVSQRRCYLRSKSTCTTSDSAPTRNTIRKLALSPNTFSSG